jgi:glutaminase
MAAPSATTAANNKGQTTASGGGGGEESEMARKPAAVLTSTPVVTTEEQPPYVPTPGAAGSGATPRGRRGSLSQDMSFSRVCEELQEIYYDLLTCDEGENASYIPELAAVNSDLFSIAVCSAQGEVWSVGDDDIHFTMQSAVKPLMYSRALQLTGSTEVHRHIGHEPSGQRFNAFVLDDDKKPHNPMINAGAIMAAAIVRSQFDHQVDAYKSVKQFVEECVGHVSSVGFDNSVFLSELGSASRNFALCYFMQEHDPLLRRVSIDRALELYFSCCSLTVDCRGLAAIAGTYAMGGTCPVTRNRVLARPMATDALQLMFGCGMYDYR